MLYLLSGGEHTLEKVILSGILKLDRVYVQVGNWWWAKFAFGPNLKGLQFFWLEYLLLHRTETLLIILRIGVDIFSSSFFSWESWLSLFDIPIIQPIQPLCWRTLYDGWREICLWKYMEWSLRVAISLTLEMMTATL